MKTEYLNHLDLYLYGMVYTSMWNSDGETEESILVSEVKKDIKILANYSKQRVWLVQKWTYFEVWKD